MRKQIPYKECSSILYSKHRIFDTDYEGRDECPVCNRSIDLLYQNWNDGDLPFEPGRRSNICGDCFELTVTLKTLDTQTIINLLKKSKKWQGVKRKAK